MNLIKKDSLFDWFVPKKKRSHGTQLGKVMRVAYTPKGRAAVVFSAALIDAHAIPYKTLTDGSKMITVAFVFAKEDPFVVFEPNRDVPYISAYAKNDARSYTANNKSLVEQIYKHFGLTNRCKYWDFNVTYWEKINGMMLYRIYPLKKDCNESEQ